MFKPKTPMPVRNGFCWILVETLIFWPHSRFHPVWFVAQHQMSPFRWRRQLAVNTRGKRMHQLRPPWIPYPKRRTTQAAEMPSCFTCFQFAIQICNFCLVNGYILFAVNSKGRVVGAQIDPETSATRRLSTYRAVTVAVPDRYLRGAPACRDRARAIRDSGIRCYAARPALHQTAPHRRFPSNY